jgi:disease resistance protein RPM1
MELPEGFSKMKFLEQLTGLWAGFSSKDKAKELRHLTRLRELALKWKQGEDLLESLCCLQKLESLDILSLDEDIDINDLKPSPNLRRLRVGGYVESLPKWINSSSVPVLSYIDLYLSEMRTEDIQSLGMLQTLRYVSVEMSRTSKRKEHNIVENLVLTAGAFPCARVCLFNKVVLVRPIIQKGAMQMVQRLRCGLQPCSIDSDNFDLSIPNLPSLEQLRIDIVKTGESTSNECSRAIDMLKRVAEDHPRRPILRHAEFY